MIGVARVMTFDGNPNRAAAMDRVEYSLTGIFLEGYIKLVVKVLSILEPNRFRIVELLRARAFPVNDIARRLNLNQPQVSKHLLALKKAGLVEVKPHAQQRFYALRPQPFRELHEWLEKYRHLWDARFEGMDELIDEELKKEREEKPHGRRQGIRDAHERHLHGAEV